jgi:hypothetical protein
MRFNLEFIIALLGALLVAYMVNKNNPSITPLITFLLLPFLIAYLIVLLINTILPGINRFGRNLYYYGSDKSLGMINDTNYMQIYPTVLIVLIIFVLLLFNGMIY